MIAFNGDEEESIPNHHQPTAAYTVATEEKEYEDEDQKVTKNVKKGLSDVLKIGQSTDTYSKEKGRNLTVFEKRRQDADKKPKGYNKRVLDKKKERALSPQEQEQLQHCFSRQVHDQLPREAFVQSLVDSRDRVEVFFLVSLLKACGNSGVSCEQAFGNFAAAICI